MDKSNKRKISLLRAEELKKNISDYVEIKENIPKGMELQYEYDKLKYKILKLFKADENDWNDWKWQLEHRIDRVNTLGRIINLTKKSRDVLNRLTEKYRWSISPYYLSLVDTKDRLDPIRLMGIPSVAEMFFESGKADPMGEESTNPAGAVTRRYPDRLIINVTNQCANYCRHCQRRRNIGQNDFHRSKKAIEESIEYVRSNREIRDVLLTGGDAFMLEDDSLEWIISSLREISHIEIIRLGTRALVTLPQRVTQDLCDMLKKYHPIYVNTHFNHPKEVTKDSKKAAEMLANSGISIGNQMVLLNGVNNNKYVVQCLNHELLKIRVRPYYIFHPKRVKGTGHFMCSVDEGLEIMEHLRGRTSGMAIPTYIINAPEGKGKTPLLPEYLISRGKDHILIRTWEGTVMECKNTKSRDMKAIFKEVDEKFQE